MSKKYYMVLDTETVADARIPYDVAFIIVDRAGNVIERYNALVKEVFDNPIMRHMLTRDSFAKRKADFYLDSNIPVQSFYDIAAYLHDTICQYHCPVVAYNISFDFKVLNDLCKVMDNIEWYPQGTEFWDLWAMSLSTVCDSGNYVRFCITNGFITDSGNISCNAESVFAYLSNNPNFAESHTALDDCEIEAKILAAVFKRHEKLDTAPIKFVTHHPVWKKRLKTH